MKEYIQTPLVIAFSIMMFLWGLRIDIEDKGRDIAGVLHIIACVVVITMASVLN